MRVATAVYPGTFDPITHGHRDIIERAANIFPRVIVSVAKVTNPSKSPLFSYEERVEMANVVLEAMDNVEVVGFSNLLAHFMDELKATIIVRGIRAVADFEYEFQMASINRHLNKKLETIFLTPSDQYTFVSSTMIREASRLDGNVSSLVHPFVHQKLLEKYRLHQ